MNLCDTHSMPFCRLCSIDPDDRIEIPGSNLKARPPKQKPRKEMKRGQLKKTASRKRPMKPEAMTELIADVMLRDGRCVAIDHTESMCDGPTEAHHLIPQRILRKHYPEGDPIFKDLDNVVALCGRHHNNVERGLLHLPDEALPDDFGRFMLANGFEIWWEAEELRRVA